VGGDDLGKVRPSRFEVVVVPVHAPFGEPASLFVGQDARAHGDFDAHLVTDQRDQLQQTVHRALSALEQDIEAHGAYYGVICNAGVTRDAAFPMLELEDWRAVIDINLNGFYNVLHPVVMPMIRRRKPGRIVTISSVSGIMGNRGQTNYSASKAGIIGATKSLAVELAKRKITVNCVAPGLIESEMTHELPLEKMLEAVPMRRLGKPEEVASVVAFLCSQDAAYVTRQVISPNGGMF
jgi:3-oxoacyl-[acyl-carrier protein] reductase